MGSLLRRLRDLRRDEDELVADELRSAASDQGCTAVAAAADRSLVTVAGMVRCVTVQPKTKVPAVVAELYDGTQPVDLVWLGRREIKGIVPGTYLRASGRLCHRGRTATIYNPAYDILPKP